MILQKIDLVKTIAKIHRSTPELFFTTLANKPEKLRRINNFVIEISSYLTKHNSSYFKSQRRCKANLKRIQFLELIHPDLSQISQQALAKQGLRPAKCRGNNAHPFLSSDKKISPNKLQTSQEYSINHFILSILLLSWLMI